MFIRCLTLLAVLGCQGNAKEPAPATPTSIEVRDGTTVIAAVRPGRPCRATIGPIELIVGGSPLVAQLGDTRWSGESTATGTILSRDDTRIARVFPVGDPAIGGVYLPDGTALIRISTTGDTAIVTNAASQQLRTVVKRGLAIAVDKPSLAVTGTSDLVLAALLTAQELDPEVRMLASCERLLATKGT